MLDLSFHFPNKTVWRKTLRALLLFAILCGTGFSRSGMAQSSDPQWEDFVNLSGTPTASTYPAIAGDASGRVHVLWSEDAGGETENILYDRDGNALIDSRGNPINFLNHDGNTLFYTRWDGETWLPPMDIQINPGGNILYPRIKIGPNGMLHAVWMGSTGERTALYYSRVFSDRSTEVRQWTRPIVLAEDLLTAYYPVDIAIDSRGLIFLLYARFRVDPGVYLIRSEDGGLSWSDPVQIFRTYDESGRNEGASTLRLAAGDQDRLHATWTRYDAGGNGKGIYYSGSEDAGLTWSAPYEVARWQPGWYETDWLVAGGVGDEIHLVWEGSSDIAATYERVSQDGGKTWSRPRLIFPKLVGENGFASLVSDSAGVLHLLVVKRGDADSIAHGVWYSQLANNRWSDPVLLGSGQSNLYDLLDPQNQPDLASMMRGTFTGGGLRYQDVAIANGNELFVVVVNEFDGEIWGSRAILDAPHVAPQVYQPPTPTFTPTEDSQDLQKRTPTPPPALLLNAEPPARQPVNPTRVVMFAALPSLLLILAMIAYKRAVKLVRR